MCIAHTKSSINVLFLYIVVANKITTLMKIIILYNYNKSLINIFLLLLYTSMIFVIVIERGNPYY